MALSADHRRPHHLLDLGGFPLSQYLHQPSRIQLFGHLFTSFSTQHTYETEQFLDSSSEQSRTRYRRNQHGWILLVRIRLRCNHSTGSRVIPGGRFGVRVRRVRGYRLQALQSQLVYFQFWSRTLRPNFDNVP